MSTVRADPGDGAVAARRPAPGASAAPGFALLWRWQARHSVLADALLGAVVLAVSLGGPLAHGGHDHDHHQQAAPGALTTTLLVVTSASLALRRRHPVPVWGACLVAAAGVILRGGQPPTTLGVCLVALYTIGTLTSLRTTLVVAVATTAVYAVVMTVVDGVFGDRTVTLLAVLGVAAAVGVAVRSQRTAVEAAEARARQAEVTREEEAVRRVTDERLRIARELHDVLAHHISVINVQAGVARHLLDVQPDQARAALGLVRESSRTVLAEMSTVLGLLRTGEDEGLLTQPAPGLEQVPALVETMIRAGLRTTWRARSEPQPLSEVADLTAYRVVQESLTNALKHGSGTAQLVLDHTPTAVVITVGNPVREDGAPSAPGGHGLVGMRERVSSLGGHLSAGAVAGSFEVRAEIPRGAL